MEDDVEREINRWWVAGMKMRLTVCAAALDWRQ